MSCFADLQSFCRDLIWLGQVKKSLFLAFMSPHNKKYIQTSEKAQIKASNTSRFPLKISK
ncbi:hypothetical protein BpHYR1_004292 [Brachionus plicatilis]|uniref:Uncharacterized protein n=1 Tax=Brachionus plicatilis TaxID=10195 RepID=A0A3M7PWZ7_BRAPC|nr:hypothetical protein BpHYR1_004292 [Brachionus plicatilis]